jgi:diguanylate cyclase (GGDEF)-like protein
MPSGRKPPRAGPRLAAVCLVTAAAVAIAGGGQAFWLCVPAALLLAASARGAAETALAATLATAAGALPSLLDAGLGPPPSLPLTLVVVGGSAAVLHGVRHRLEAEREALRASASTDPLTGALNRRGLAERLGYEIARHARQRREFAVLALDLDGFKLVNDRFGHHAGDDVLRDVAAAMRSAVRDQDSVARLGGDEFCVLAPETDRVGADQLAARVAEAIASATRGMDALSASIGVAVYPLDGRSARAVLEAADAAQVSAKRRGPGRRRASRMAA